MTEWEHAGTPSRTAGTMDEVLADLDHRGFSVVTGLLSPSHCATISEALKVLLLAEQKNRRPTGHQRVLHLAAKNEVFLPLVMHPFVLELWRQRLGRDMLCSSFTANSLWPGCTEQYWHVDHPYWTMSEPYPLTLPLCGQTIWMIDAFTEENGATAVLPRSHLVPHLPMVGSGWIDDGVILTAGVGGAIFMDGALWHTSRPNRTGELRSAVLVKYIRSFCIQQEDMRLQLDCIDDAPDGLATLFGADQYVPRRGFPY